MECTYSLPLDFEGNVPGSDITAFGFSKSNCVLAPTATPSAQASTSAVIRFDDLTNYSIGSTVWLFFFIALLLVIFQGWQIGLWIFRKQ